MTVKVKSISVLSPSFVIIRSPEGEECQHVTETWKDTGTPWISRAGLHHHSGCPGLSQALAEQLQ